MRILAADDDPIQLEAMRAWLSRLPAQVITLDNGSDAWDVLSREAFDLAVIDIHMPGLDGFGLIHWLRQTPRTVDLPIIVVTSRQDSDAIEKAYAAGASSFVTKPVNWQLFSHQARFVMRSGQVERTMRAETLAHEAAQREKDQIFALISDALQKAEVQTPTISGLVQDLRLLSLAGRGEIARETVNCDGLLAEVAQHCHSFARARALEIRARESLEVISLSCDASMLRAALIRVCRELAEFSVRGGLIELSAHVAESGGLKISIRSGSAAELPPDIRLAVAAGIAAAHGGNFVIHAVPGEGAAAAISLPARLVQTELRHSPSSLRLSQSG